MGEISVWRGQFTVQRFRRFRAHIESMLPKYPQRANITVIEGGSLPRLNAEERAEAGTLAQDFAAGTLGAAHVLESRGFEGAATRMVLAGLLRLSRPHHPVRVFDTVRSSASWVAELVSEPNDRAATAFALCAEVEETRRRLTAFSASR